MRNVLCCLALMAAALGQSGGGGGGIQGTVTDQSGQGLADAYVIASPVKPGTTLMAISGSDGKYSIAQAPPGNYSVCVQFRRGYSQPGGSLPKPAIHYVDSCYWSDPTPVTVTAGQVTAHVNIGAAKGAVVHVRLNDPGKHMANSGGAVLIGLVGPSSRWRPLHVVSSDPSGRTLELAIPLNTALRLEVNGGGLQLADEGGVPLSAVSTSFSILQAAGQRDPSLTFNITGKRP